MRCFWRFLGVEEESCTPLSRHGCGGAGSSCRATAPRTSPPAVGRSVFQVGAAPLRLGLGCSAPCSAAPYIPALNRSYSRPPPAATCRCAANSGRCCRCRSLLRTRTSICSDVDGLPPRDVQHARASLAQFVSTCREQRQHTRVLARSAGRHALVSPPAPSAQLYAHTPIRAAPAGESTSEQIDVRVLSKPLQRQQRPEIAAQRQAAAGGGTNTAG